MINVQLRCNAHRCSPGMSRHSRQACDVISSSSQSVFIRTAQLSVACVSGVKQAVEICPWKQKRGIRVVSLFSFISKGKLSDWRITPDSANSEFCFFFCVKVSSWNLYLHSGQDAENGSKCSLLNVTLLSYQARAQKEIKMCEWCGRIKRQAEKNKQTNVKSNLNCLKCWWELMVWHESTTYLPTYQSDAVKSLISHFIRYMC